MVEYSSVIIPLSVALALSLAVERVLELARHIMEPFLGGKGARKMPDLNQLNTLIKNLQSDLKTAKQRKSVELQAEETIASRKKRVQEYKKIEQTLVTQTAAMQQEKKGDLVNSIITNINKLKQDPLVEQESQLEWGENFDQSTVLFEPATDPEDSTTLKAFVLQILGFAAGIILAHLFDVQLFKALLIGEANSISVTYDYLLTGLVIGGGSKPIHILIRFVTQRKITVSEKPADAEKAEEKAVSAAVAAIPVQPVMPVLEARDGWVDIAYVGGVDRQKLETAHVRDKNPTMVIYHHTAMHSDSTFEDVVRVIKSRKDSKGNSWLTGYNCVVMADGAIRPFCRWDRYGNHAAGYNRQSLGLAFNGNFETNASVPYSNPNGRFGIQRPTELQLKAGARVVALWAILYEIDLNFDELIIPHSAVSTKTCPGGNFPTEEFTKRIQFYHGLWEQSDFVKARIAEFAQKPFLKVTVGGA